MAPSCLLASAGMTHEVVRPPEARAGDRVAVLSPSFAAAGAFPVVHEQAMRRFAEVTGCVPVEYPTTRQVGASPGARPADLNAAFADPTIRGLVTVVGGEDQITVIPHLDSRLVRADPKPFLGTSDNTNLHHWLWANGVASFYGGSTQVHLGPGLRGEDVRARSLRAALTTGGVLEITDPGESEDVGVDWDDPRALTSFGEREPTEPWAWYGPARSATGRSWGGCLEVIQWILAADRFPFDAGVLEGQSCSWRPARNCCRLVRSAGSSARSASGGSSRRSAPSSSRGHRCPTSPVVRTRTSVPDCARRSGTSSSTSWPGTTRTRCAVWACPSGTRGRSGSFRTVAPSPWTASPSGCTRTTPDPRAAFAA